VLGVVRFCLPFLGMAVCEVLAGIVCRCKAWQFVLRVRRSGLSADSVPCVAVSCCRTDLSFS